MWKELLISQIVMANSAALQSWCHGCFELCLQCAMLLKSFGLIHLLSTVVQRATEEKPISRAAVGRLFLTSWLLDNKDWRSLFVQQEASVFVSIRIDTQDLECSCWPASAGSSFCLYLRRFCSLRFGPGDALLQPWFRFYHTVLFCCFTGRHLRACFRENVTAVILSVLIRMSNRQPAWFHLFHHRCFKGSQSLSSWDCEGELCYVHLTECDLGFCWFTSIVM